MADDRCKKWPRKLEAEEYMEKHRIMELFNNLTAQLIFNKPDHPKEFITSYIEKLIKSRSTGLNQPCLFDEINVSSIFGMLDPTGKGYISHTQYKEALTTMGIKNFEEKPSGWEQDRIQLQTFKREAEKGLADASSTYSR